MSKQKQTKINIYERYTEWYLDELLEHGYIKWYKREPETFVVAEKLQRDKVKRLKRNKDTVEPFNLFPVIRYTYDYIVCWTTKARYLFYDLSEIKVFRFGRSPFIANLRQIGEENEHVSYIDTKPPSRVSSFGRVSSNVTFPIKQRMLYERTGVYINKFIPIPMAGVGDTIAKYCTTFRPKRYIFTDAEGSSRVRKTPKWRQVDLSQFVKIRLETLKEMLNHDRRNDNKN